MATSKAYVFDGLLRIGGDFPESKLPKLYKTLKKILNNDPNKTQPTTDYRKLYQYIDSTQDASLDIPVKLVNSNILYELFVFCANNNLKTLVRTPPHINSIGESCNESVWLSQPSGDHIVVPTDGEMQPTTLVEDVFTALNEIITEYEKPLDQAPLDINSDPYTADIARRKLAGQDLRKILIESLASRIAYPELTVPPFRIIKGV